ncbi:unnamed protein product [Rotaria magnacalcarata]|uniref:Trichohyalin-plectin-homology domain-containing protein n=12 Tax=Rotaria magnacalcarata TaxID=392030 RepID=A0A816LQ20_9BILA|nr:unnamed protein product [Rotaria magnacalcarata]CAF1528906.1 unnamed protein product [Rotaria magnacalcarata]CAF1900050.1 unnamed protein product [Rotaria magnacalcarata]CAF1937123.1 unnamed protein product [Rotaria magnacalcarata]CAF2227805.1 unnamed protein product [Rotaria magnacalcarata]
MVIKTLPDPLAKPIANTQLLLQRQRRSHSAPYPAFNRTEIPQQHRLPDAADLRRMCIITKNDLNRIYENLDHRQRSKDAIQQEIARKKEIAERSAQVTKHWTNTIAGARERKLEMRKIREQEEEDRKKLLDIEEEKLAAERRREHIEKAKQLKYYETDRVRTFHSALLHTEVLKERDLQIEMKKRIEQMRQTDDEQERQRYQVAQNDYLRAEQEKAEKKARDRSNLSQYHIAQMERKRMQHMNEKQKDLQEGEEYRRLGEQYAHEQMEIERFRKLTQHDVKNMYDQALDDKFKVRQMEKQLDEEEDDELRIYADAKKHIARLRRQKEFQAHQEKQDARDYMTGYLGSLQKRAEANLDTQMFRARAEREAKELREEQEKLDKQRKMKDSINKYRQEAMKRREAEKEMDERDDAELRLRKAEADQLFLIYQQEKDKKRDEDAQAVSEHLLKQAQERKDRERALKATEVDEVQLDKHMSEIERQQFQDYAGRVISYMDENGRNTYPMKKVYVEEMKRFDQWNQGYRKNESRSSNSESKPRTQEKNTYDQTKKNLGFQWDIPQQ